jgi:ribonuclease HI
MGKLLTIYTDGACQVSTGNGGVGVVFIKDNEVIYQFNKHFKNVTNNQMEIMAVIYALHAISINFDSITVVSDSQYVLGCTNKGWKRKKNQNYWQLFDKVYNRAKKFCSDIKFEWTKGHNIDEYNNLADRLAVEASHFAD